MSRVSSGRNLRSLNKRLQQMARTTAIRVAQQAATDLTAIAGSDYDGGRTAYGATRPLGVGGNALSLVKTGKTRSFMKFLNDGSTRLTVFLLTPYAKYLIGKYTILPAGNAAMPGAWRLRITAIADRECDVQARRALEGL